MSTAINASSIKLDSPVELFLMLKEPSLVTTMPCHIVLHPNKWQPAIVKVAPGPTFILKPGSILKSDAENVTAPEMVRSLFMQYSVKGAGELVIVPVRVFKHKVLGHAQVVGSVEIKTVLDTAVEHCGFEAKTE